MNISNLPFVIGLWFIFAGVFTIPTCLLAGIQAMREHNEPKYFAFSFLPIAPAIAVIAIGLLLCC